MSVLALLLVLAPQSAALEVEGEGVELVWTCAVHREITDSEPGQCPFGDGELVQTLIQRAYSCPIHPVISQETPGRCPVCARELYLVSVELAFACPMHPGVRETAPGSCPICSMALEPETSSRPHQDHNPKHGGLFFMAPDNWHHLEGAYPEEGVFRVYFYDNYSQPMKAETFAGRAVLDETFDASTKQTREIHAEPLVASPDGAYLEARIGNGRFPREVTAKLQFARGSELERFDFVFTQWSREGGAVEAATTDAADGPGLVVPETPAAIAAAIAQRNASLRELVASGAFGQLYVPALEAKDLALALEGRLLGAPGELNGELAWALKQLVRSAWLLDGFGDLGNREKVLLAYDLFHEATEKIQAIYSR